MFLRFLAILDVGRAGFSIPRTSSRFYRWLVFLFLLFCGTAQAATYTFSGSSFPACAAGWSQSGSTWSCAFGDVTLNTGDNILPASGITIIVSANFTLNGNNTIGSASAKVNLSTDYGALTLKATSTVYGNLSANSGPISVTGTTVNGNVSANSSNISLTSTTVNGTLATSGALTTSGGGITGNVSANNGVTSSNGTVFGGSITSTTGGMSFAGGGSVAGNVTSNGALTATGGVVFSGNVTATNGALTLTGGSVTGAVLSGCCVVTLNNTNVGGGVSSGAVNGSGGSTVIINGGTISGNVTTSGGNGVSINSGANVTGNVTSSCCTVVINNSTVTGTVTSNGGAGVQIQNGATVNGNVNAPSYQPPSSVVDPSSVVHGVCNSQTTSTTDPGSYNNLCDGGAAAAPHHLEIDLPSASGLTCQSSTLTIKACADAACSTLYTSGVTGALSASGATVNWSGTSSFSIASGSSTTTKSIQVTTPGNAVLGAASAPAASAATTCNFGGSTNCTFTAADAGFLVSAPNHSAESVSTLTVQAVKKADNSSACTAAFTGAKTVTLTCAYANPATGTKPVRVGGTALNAAANAASACDAAGRSVSLNFNASGIATPSLQYADAGQVTVAAAYTGAPGSLEQGLNMNGSGAFIAAPASFSFSNVTASPLKAGRAFNATVAALNAASAATPNFGKESTAQGVTLSTSLVTPSPVTYPSAANPALSGGALAGNAFNTGVAALTNLAWSEVGSVTLKANLANANGYLSSGLYATGTSGTLRFIPDHFNIEVLPNAGVPMPCPTGLVCPQMQPMTDTSRNGFVYSGQPFALAIYARSYAQNPINETTTQNYNSAYGLSNSTTLSAHDGSGNAPGGAGTLASTTVAASLFLSGIATVTVNMPSYTFTASPTTPTDVYLRTIEISGDGVTSQQAAASVEGGVKVVSGRIRLLSAYGAVSLPLTLNAAVQYWNGISYVTSSTDSVSTFSVPNLTSQCVAGSSVSPPTLTQSPPASMTFSSGAASFVLKASTPGSVSLTASAPSWLPSSTACATFGIYGSDSNLIYMRERY